MAGMFWSAGVVVQPASKSTAMIRYLAMSGA
jgi:hypothetical protein